MISDIIDVSVIVLPALAIGQGMECFSKEQYELYSNKLLASKDSIVMDYIEEFQGLPSVDIASFIYLIDKEIKFSYLLSSYKMREYLRKYV